MEVAGSAPVTNSANSGVVTAVFPKTGDSPPAKVTIDAITGVSVPVTGGTPVAAITETDQYTGSVSWNPPAANFAADTTYTATISLTPKPGYTFSGVAADFFTVAGATATANSTNSGVVTAKFPATVEAPYDGTVYELSLGEVNGEPAWIGGPAISDIPPGTIYDKNDLNWNDEWEGDYQNHWIDVGSVLDNKLTIDLPATVPDDMLREEGGNYFGWFGSLEVRADYGFRLMCLEGPFAGDALFYYAKNAVDDHDVDGEPVDLKLGWNFMVMPFADDGRWKAESLAELYQKGFRWYLEPASSEDFDVPGIYEATVNERAVSLCLNNDGSFFALGASNPTPTGIYTVDGTDIQLNFLFNSPETAQWNGTISSTGIDFDGATYARKAGAADSLYAGTWANWQKSIRTLVAGDLTMTVELYTGGEDHNEDDWGIIAKGFLEVSEPVSFNITHAWDPAADAWTNDSTQMNTLLPFWQGVYAGMGTIDGTDMDSVIQIPAMNITLTKQPPNGGLPGGNDPVVPPLTTAPLGETITIESEQIYKMSGAAETFDADLDSFEVSYAKERVSWDEIFTAKPSATVTNGVLSATIGAPKDNPYYMSFLEQFKNVIPSGISISVPEARYFGLVGVNVFPGEYDGELNGGVFALKSMKDSDDRNAASWAYVDRDVKMTGRSGNTVYYMDLKKGWNWLTGFHDDVSDITTIYTKEPGTEFRWEVAWVYTPPVSSPEGNSLTITDFPAGEGENITIYAGTDFSNPESLVAVGTGVVTDGSVEVPLFIPSENPSIPSSDPWTETGDYIIIFTMSGTGGFMYVYTGGQTGGDPGSVPTYHFNNYPATLNFSDFYYRAGDGGQFGTRSDDGSLSADNIWVDSIVDSTSGTIWMVNDNASPPVKIAQVGTIANGRASITLPADLPTAVSPFMDTVTNGDEGMDVTPSPTDFLHRYTFYVYSGDAELGTLSIGNHPGVTLNYWYFENAVHVTGGNYYSIHVRKGWNPILFGGNLQGPTSNMADAPDDLHMTFTPFSGGPSVEAYSGEWLWEGGDFQGEPQPVKLMLGDGEFIWRQQTTPVAAFWNILRGTYEVTDDSAVNP